MPLIDTIDDLVAFGPRLPGSDADRAATDYIGDRLKALDRKVDSDDLRVRPDRDIAAAIHAALAAIGTVVSTRIPPLGLVILLLTAASMYLDLSGHAHIVRGLLPRRRTRNVSSPGALEEARVRVIVTAHHDSGRTGLLYGQFGGRLPGALGRLAGPLDLIFWTVALALVLAAARVSIGDSGLITTIQFIVVVLLLLATLGLVDAAFAKPSPGASDNASGVAAALELGHILRETPTKNVDVWFAFTAANGGLALGMREWIRKRKSLLERKPSVFINIDAVGSGDVRFARGEGHITLYWHEQHLIDTAEEVAEKSSGEPCVLRRATDGVIPAIAGFPSITICCLDEDGRVVNSHSASDTVENIDRQSVENATAFVEQMVRRLDSEVGPPKKLKAATKRKPKPKAKPKAKPKPKPEPEAD